MNYIKNKVLRQWQTLFPPLSRSNQDKGVIQKPLDAIRDCIGRLMPERLEAATNAAYEHGYLYEEDKDALLTEIRNGNQTAS